MPCLITALTRSVIEKLREKNKQQKKQIKNSTAKTNYLKLNASSNNAKKQSYETLTAQIYFFYIIQQISLNETR